MEYTTNDENLEKIIIRLISLKQEGEYWDFKREWHSNKGSLLHDIICMANNLYNRDSYIIIGVDEENDYRIASVENDPNRKNTQKIVTFLKDKKFAGGVRPLVYVKTLQLTYGTVDVIVIENSYDTPFYLTEQYKEVRANNIYTRVMDTNTSIDKSADINNIEYLWRKRFHLDETPLDKFQYYLFDSYGWDKLQDDKDGFFYKFFPEYSVVCKEDKRTGYEYYLFGQYDTTPDWYMVTLFYHQTAVERFLANALDGGRCFVITPQRCYEMSEYGIAPFGYYVKNSLRYSLFVFYQNLTYCEEYSLETYLKSVIIFSSEYEKQCFLDYLKSNIKKYKMISEKITENYLPYFPKLKGYTMEKFKKDYKDAIVVKKMLEEFREKNQLYVGGEE